MWIISQMEKRRRGERQTATRKSGSHLTSFTPWIQLSQRSSSSLTSLITQVQEIPLSSLHWFLLSLHHLQAKEYQLLFLQQKNVMTFRRHLECNSLTHVNDRKFYMLSLERQNELFQCFDDVMYVILGFYHLYYRRQWWVCFTSQWIPST